VRQLVDVNPAIGRLDRLLDAWLPAGKILSGDQPAFLTDPAHELLRDIAAIEAFVGGHDSVAPALSGGKRLLLGFDELRQGRSEVGLAKDLAWGWRFALLAEVRQHHGP